MKARIRIALLIVASITTTFLFSCSLSSTSIEDRLKDFFSTLNGDRSKTHKDLDPNIAAYSTADAGFWEGHFPAANEPYTYTAPNTSPTSDVTTTISDNTVPLGLWHFNMVDIGSSGSENWVIHDITGPAGSIL